MKRRVRFNEISCHTDFRNVRAYVRLLMDHERWNIQSMRERGTHRLSGLAIALLAIFWSASAVAETPPNTPPKIVVLRAPEGPHSKRLTYIIRSELRKHGYAVTFDGSTLLEPPVAIVSARLYRRKRRWIAQIELLSEKDEGPLVRAKFQHRSRRRLRARLRKGLWRRLQPILQRQYLALSQESLFDDRELDKPAAEPSGGDTQSSAPTDEPLPQKDPRGSTTDDLIYVLDDGTKEFRRSTSAARRTGKILIDGRADEDAWQAVPETLADAMQRPAEGPRAFAKTYFRVLYDDEAVYVHIRAIDPDPSKIDARLSRGDTWDGFTQSDWLGFTIDPTLSRRDSYGFKVNPAGIKLDYRITKDEWIWDVTYDAVWEVATARQKDGWSAEFRVPYSQMRINEGRQDRWGFELWRFTARKQEYDVWSPFPMATGRTTSLLGDLVIEDTIKPKQALEVIPYVALGLDQGKTITADGESTEFIKKIGADFRAPLGSSLTLTGAINPEFGQLEADPSTINLTRREIFFPERRPFFTKDSELFVNIIGRGSERLFYSRRIGAPPHLTQAGAPGVVNVEEDRETSIWGAAKLTGSAPGDINIGLMTALTAKKTSIATLDSGEKQRAVIEPMAVYNVGQAEKNFRNGQSSIRLALTAVNRFLDGTGITVLHRQAYTSNLQYEHRFANNTWMVSAQASGSYIEGPTPSIALTQTASQRYFQRPDADYVSFDPDRTSLAGTAYRLNVARISGDVTGAVGVDARTPGFEANDVGFLLDADLINPYLELTYEKLPMPPSKLKLIQLDMTLDSYANFGGEVLGHSASLAATIMPADFSILNLTYAHDFNQLDTQLLRGGPAVAGSDENRASFDFVSNPRSKVRGEVYVAQAWQPASDSYHTEAATELAWSPRPNIEIGIRPSYERFDNSTQYIDADTVSASPHYILGRLKQSTLATTLRLAYTLSPKLSFEFYGQPFISAGKFTDYKETADVRASAFDERFQTLAVSDAMGAVDVDYNGDGATDYSFGNPDFSVVDLNSNAVIRWEYRPGSTAYLIWSHAASGFAPDGALDKEDYRAVFRARGEDIFLFKVSYWWSH